MNDYVQKAVIAGLEMYAVPHPTVVACDYPGCTRQFPEGVGIRGDDARLRREAHAAGWTGLMNRYSPAPADFCPEHSK